MHTEVSFPIAVLIIVVVIALLIAAYYFGVGEGAPQPVLTRLAAAQRSAAVLSALMGTYSAGRQIVENHGVQGFEWLR